MSSERRPQRECGKCRWWNRYGNARSAKDDTGSCMQRQKTETMPAHVNADMKFHDTCEFFNRSPEEIEAANTCRGLRLWQALGLTAPPTLEAG